MASDLRMDVQPYGDGRVLLTIGGLSMTLEPSARDKLRELLDRAAMPGRVNHGPACKCTPCLAEPSYVSRREAAAVPHIVTDPDAHRRHGCTTCLET